MLLDSLLIGVARERFGDDAIDDVPLLRSNGLLHASQLLAGTPDAPLIRSTTYIQSFIRVLSNEQHITDMLTKQPPPSSMNHGSGPNSNVESVYVTHNIPTIYFLGVGDLTRIRSLLLTMVHIGGQRFKGNGEVERAIVTPVSIDPTWFGIIGQINDQPHVLRPVPTRLTHLLPAGTVGFDNMETCDYPYVPGHPKAVMEPCLVPTFTNGDYFRHDTIGRLCKSNNR
jgi:hypothetical protein